jgi:threonine dehydrogenase-like Zn-dependent dehydrogenase
MVSQSHWVCFVAPGKAEVISEPLAPPEAGEVQVQTHLSAISSGSELLVYRGQAPTDLAIDDTLPALMGDFTFPIRYGYAVVGEVVATGAGVEPGWKGRQVFVFHPHADIFNTLPEACYRIPENISAENALFLPNMETAVNFVMDGKPLIGERVVVFGQGVVGLLTTALLAEFPLSDLVTLDRFPLRRQASLQLGARASYDPNQKSALDEIRQRFPLPGIYPGADLVYELSGTPATLNQAISLTGFNGRVVIGSWYGQKSSQLDLGGRFHRARLHLISSQVSSLAPEFTGRWSKGRRLEVAWENIQRIQPARLISHRFPQEQAAEAYRLLDEKPEETLQLILTYD